MSARSRTASPWSAAGRRVDPRTGKVVTDDYANWTTHPNKRLLDAVHRQPPVQAEPADARRPKDMHYTALRRPPDPRRHGGPLVRQRRPLPAEDRRGDPSRPASWTTHPPSRWATRRRSSWPTGCVDIAPEGFDHVLFTNSGSESVETALKMALAYHRVPGRRLAHPPDRARARLSRRQFRRHLGGRHRQQPQDVRHAADRRRPHAAHPLPRKNAFTRGQPEHGATWPTSSSASSRCMTPPPSPP
jgi:hypothetical protein